VRLLTASSLQRYAMCAASAVLPRVESAPHERTVRGSAIHSFLEAVPVVGREEALATVPEEWRAACALIDLDALPLDGAKVAQEVTYAFNVATGKARELGRSLGRDYRGTCKATEIVGTADVVGLSADGTAVYVDDFKTGRSELARAAVNWQLRMLALAACRTYGARRAHVSLIHIEDNGTAWADRASFDAFDLDVIAADLRALVARVREAAEAVAAGASPTCTTSDLCRWCPSLTYCPAQTALVRTVIGELDTDPAGGFATPVTVEQASTAWERLKSIKAAIKRAEQALYTYAAAHPIPLPGGMVLGPVETSREDVDGEIARRVLAEIHGAEVAERACDWSTSKAAIERALRPLATKERKITHLKRDALAAIAEAGGVRRNVTTSIREHVPIPDEQAKAIVNDIAQLGIELAQQEGRP
jgi:hypothetical protein